MCKMFLDKRAQIGETITWIVATIIIISILGITFFVAEISLGKNKNIKQTTQADILVSKSFFSYLLTDDIYNQLKTEENLNNVSGDLALKIFEEYYGEEYVKVWVGIVLDRTLFPYKQNDYFGIRPTEIRGGDLYQKSIPHIIEKISLDENRTIQTVLKIK